MSFIKRVFLIFGLFYFISISPPISSAQEISSETYELIRHLGNGDFKAGLNHLKDLASKGNGAATFFLAMTAVQMNDMDNALGLFNLAAKQGDSNAMKYLGTIYFKGALGEKDYKLARTWFDQAAALRNINSMVYLGIIHRDGLGAPVDIERAYFWFSLAGILKEDAAGDKEPEEFAEEIEARISPVEIIKIKTEIEVWLKKNPAVPDATIPKIAF